MQGYKLPDENIHKNIALTMEHMSVTESPLYKNGTQRGENERRTKRISI